MYTKEKFGESASQTVLHDQYNNPLEVPLMDDFQIEVIAAGDQVDNRAFTISLYIASY